MDDAKPDFDQQDSGVPVTSPDRNPDPIAPPHSVEPGVGGGSGDKTPADAVRGDSGDTEGAAGDSLAERAEGEAAVPKRQSGLSESNPAEGL